MENKDFRPSKIIVQVPNFYARFQLDVKLF